MPPIGRRAQLVEIHRGVGRRVLRVAVREASSESGLPHRVDLGGRVFRAARVVRPVVDGGDAAVDRLGERQSDARRAVLGLEARRQPLHRRRETACDTCTESARDRVPHVPVSVDETRQRDGTRAVDLVGVSGVEVRPDRADDPAVHDDVGVLELTERRVHRQDAADPADDEPATARGLGGGLRAPGGGVQQGSGEGSTDERAASYVHTNSSTCSLVPGIRPFAW
jgi:hypothetical protein